MSIVIENVGPDNRVEVEAFLSRHEECCQFLINNLQTYGPTLTSHHNSGNFKLIRSKRGVTGVFCLAKRGNLFIQTDEAHAIEILDEYARKEIQIRGFLGEWTAVEGSVLNFV